MITVTNPKIAGFAPRWAVFRGFSILFDNPGNSLTRSDNRLNLSCDIDADLELGFYQSLHAGLAALNSVALLTNTYLFCPLPSRSYHVTVWDGGNDGNLAHVFNAQRHKLEGFLADLPASIMQPHEATELAAASPLVHREWNICFRFDRLAKWGNYVIVARLAPADPGSTRAFEELVIERSRLSTRFRQAFGISPWEPYEPHVTLGYFANREAAQLATPCMAEWHQLFAEQLHGMTLSFRRTSVYGFTDMVTFFKAANDY